MALLSEEMAEKLIALYKNKKDRKNKNYRLSKDTFKNMAGIERLSRTYLSRVDSELRKKELMLLDIIKEYEQIGP